MKPFICVDFDGVLNNYKGYEGDNLGTIRPGAREFLQTLSQDYTVSILSVRSYHLIIRWLEQYDLLQYVDEVTSIKRAAVAYVDDRGLRFNGNYEEVLEQLENFKPYWEEKSDA